MAGDLMLHTFDVLLQEGDDAATGVLIAAIYARAVLTGETPRTIVDRLFVALPSAEEWPEFLEALTPA